MTVTTVRIKRNASVGTTVRLPGKTGKSYFRYQSCSKRNAGKIWNIFSAMKDVSWGLTGVFRRKDHSQWRKRIWHSGDICAAERKMSLQKVYWLPLPTIWASWILRFKVKDADDICIQWRGQHKAKKIEHFKAILANGLGSVRKNPEFPPEIQDSALFPDYWSQKREAVATPLINGIATAPSFCFCCQRFLSPLIRESIWIRPGFMREHSVKSFYWFVQFSVWEEVNTA